MRIPADIFIIAQHVEIVSDGVLPMLMLCGRPERIHGPEERRRLAA